MRQRQLTTSDLEDLLHRLHATATIKSQPTYSYVPWEYNTASEYSMSKKVYDTVELQLPLDKLREVAEILYDVDELQRYYGPGILRVGQQVMVDNMILRKERQIRDKNPAVQKAWERYQTLMSLVKDDK